MFSLFKRDLFRRSTPPLLSPSLLILSLHIMITLFFPFPLFETLRFSLERSTFAFVLVLSIMVNRIGCLTSIGGQGSDLQEGGGSAEASEGEGGQA